MRISTKFTPGYIDIVYGIWYDAGKPHATKLRDMISIDEFANEKPRTAVLRDWMKHEKWIERTEMLDAEYREMYKKERVQVKVEMMDRHAEVGREMQMMSLQWLRDNKDNLTPGTAVRMLVDGIEIEQGTAGISEALKKLQKMDDEKLLKEITESLADAQKDAYNA